MEYSAIIATNNLDRIKFSAEYLVAHSAHCKELFIEWNGPSDDFLALCLFADQLTSKYATQIYANSQFDRDVYGMYNAGVTKASKKHVLLINDDMYVPMGWDSNLTFIDEMPIDLGKTILTFQLVEPGYIDVNSRNIHRNFGEVIEEFDKEAFDKFAIEEEASITCKQLYNKEWVLGQEVSLGWFMPVIFPRLLFNAFGQYGTYPPFPHPHDTALFGRFLSDPNIIFVNLSSRIYHFQRLSQRINYAALSETKLNLACGADKRIGWLNADFRDSDYDVDLSLGVLPFKAEQFEEVLFKHALEHFRQEIGEKILLEIKRVLKKGGFADIYVPDLEMACMDFVTGAKNPAFAHPLNRIYGLNDSEQQVHKWGYTQKSLTALLEQLSFSKIECLPKNDMDELSVRAYK